MDANAAWALVRESLPDDQKAFLKANGHDSHGLSEILGAYDANRRHVGADKADLIRRPKGARDADPEAWKAYDAALGVVDKPDAFPEYKGPDGVDIDKLLPADVRTRFDELAVERGGMIATPEGRQAALDLFFAMAPEADAQAQASYQASVEEALKPLKGEWGGQYAARVEAGQKALAALLPEAEAKDFGEFIKSTGLGDDPQFLKLGYALAEKLSEGGLPNPNSKSGNMGMTPDAAKQEIAKLEAMPAFSNANDPGHADVIRRRNAAYKAAYPETPA